MNQTPVRWLVEKLNQCEPWYSGVGVPKDHIDKLIAEALIMEKEEKESKWIDVQEQRPEPYVEVLVKCPTGLVRIASWRAAYLIFTCQSKGESTLGWKWKPID